MFCSFAEQERGPGIAVPGQFRTGHQQPRGRESLPILRRALLDDGKTRPDQREQEQHSQNGRGTTATTPVTSDAGPEKLSSARAQLYPRAHQHPLPSQQPLPS
jgi:hypothetical protein